MKKKIIVRLLIIFGIAIVAATSIWQFYDLGEAPDFYLTELGGDTFRLSDFKGKVVVISFIVTSCNKSSEQIPQYKTIIEKYDDEIVLISVDINPQDSEDTLRTFIQQFPYADWIWTRDTANLAEAYKVFETPKTTIIDRTGYIKFTHTGVTDASTLIQEIDKLIS